MKATVGGVYFLIDNGWIVYVGKSKDIYKRIAQHKSTEKKFDAFFFVEINDVNERARYETQFIERLEPEYNVQHIPTPLEDELRFERESNTELRHRINELNSSLKFYKDNCNFLEKQIQDMGGSQ